MNMKALVPWGRDKQLPGTRISEDTSPFAGLHRQVDRLFDDFFRDFQAPPRAAAWGDTNWPSLELREDEGSVHVVAELPGLDEKDIEITLREGVLTLSGEKKHESTGPTYSERWQGRFSRSIDLGSDIDPDKVKAAFDRGVLTVTLGKRPEAQRRVRKIAINNDTRN
jgi:HSP20 family protein